MSTFAPGHVAIATFVATHPVAGTKTNKIPVVVVRHLPDGSWRVVQLTGRSCYGSLTHPGSPRSAVSQWAACGLTSPSYLHHEKLSDIAPDALSHTIGVVTPQTVWDIDDVIDLPDADFLSLMTAAKLVHDDTADAA